MFTFKRVLLVAAAAVATLLSATTAAAATYKVSRDIGIYAKADVSQGLGVVKAGETVDVQCWTTGQRIAGYAIWDRIAFGAGTAYVHDKYVEMPGGRSPAENKIPACPGAGQPAPPAAPERCAAPAKPWQRWLSVPSSITRDSYFRVQWSPKICPGQNGDYNVRNAEPTDEAMSISTISGLSLELAKAVESANGTRVTVTGKARQCAIGKFTGFCFTAAKVKLVANLVRPPSGANRVTFAAPQVSTTGPGRAVFGGPMVWTDRLL